MSQISPFIQEHCDKFLENTSIGSRVSEFDYEKYNIKRGLRNADGTGVMAGISKVGSVQGYVIQDEERVPTPGRLFYRGIDLNQIVEGFWNEGRQGMAETAYLLLFGELPTAQKHEEFSQILIESDSLPIECMNDIFLKSPHTDIMNLLARCVLAFYAQDPEADDTSLPNLMRQCTHLIAAFPRIVASGYAALHGQPISTSPHTEIPAKTLAETFLYYLREDHAYTEDEVRLLDLCMVLHAEHGGGNNSTFTCRVLSSSGTDTYSAIAGAISSLKGPIHGGANIKVTRMIRNMMENIKDLEDDEEINQYLLKILKKEANDNSGKIYGIGHAIYTLSDPRTLLLREHSKALVRNADSSVQQEFAFMQRVERLAPHAFYQFKSSEEKMICANVDFYSGLVYRLLGIPEELFTPLFAISRICGWSAHRIEETILGGRIIRPAYKTLSLANPYTPIHRR